MLHANNEDWSDCADAQADLSIRLAHMSECTFVTLRLTVYIITDYL